MTSKRIAIIGSLVGVGILAILGVGGFLGYKKAVANLNEIDSRFMEILRERGLYDVGKSFSKDKYHNAYILVSNGKREDQKKLIVNQIVTKVQFDNEKSAKDNIEIFKEARSSKTYEVFSYVEAILFF